MHLAGNYHRRTGGENGSTGDVHIVIPDIVTSLFVTILLIQVCKLAYFILPLYMGRAHLYQLQYQY